LLQRSKSGLVVTLETLRPSQHRRLSLRTSSGENIGRAALLLAVLLTACQTPAPPSPAQSPSAPPSSAPPSPAPTAPPPVKTVTLARYEPVAPGTLPAIADADLRAAWPALLASCRAFERGAAARREAWRAVCARAAQTPVEAGALRRFFATEFDGWRVLAETREDAPDGNGRPLERAERGRITGYYEPQLDGSRAPRAPYTVPLHRVPDDLLIIDLGSLYPELAGKRVRGRLDGRRVLPYWSRAELTPQRLRGAELLWVSDPIEAFFLQVQGSGRVRLQGGADEGKTVRVAYADANGHPYKSIGRWLIEQGELTADQASMQGIQAWARANPPRLAELLNQNPSYVFFRELPLGDPAAGPVGALGVPLTPGYSLAVDPRFMPLGAPLLLATVHPEQGRPLTRLMLAQDTGGAITGPLRFDFFWGFGRTAGETAGRQRHEASAVLLLPKGLRPESLLPK
jgi:membrane-bound lytic murein transglycosylase A